MGCLTLTATRKDALTGTATRKDALTGIATRKDAMCGSASLVCAINIHKYLFVTPEEQQWITDYDSVLYDVVSNASWQATENPME